MAKFDLLHLSDPHWGNAQSPFLTTDWGRLGGALRLECSNPLYVVMSGDITFKGSADGYREAGEATRALLAALGVAPERFFACPGNHDIVRETQPVSPFAAFDGWVCGLRSDKQCAFGRQSVKLVEAEHADFLLVNSAYHGSKDYGLAPSLGEVLTTAAEPPGKPRIGVVHHHLVPVHRDDVSTMRNAYGFLKVMERHGFMLVLHGHQHAMLSLAAGMKRMAVSGAGSAALNTPGYLNSGAVYTVDDGALASVRRFAITLERDSRLAWLLGEDE